MNRRFSHAEHHKELSELLYKEGKFLDWSNTTAFYSALHFVQGKLLPGPYNDIWCETIEDVLRAFRSRGKHQATHHLVQTGLPGISVFYAFLMNFNFTARYIDYKIHPEHAKLCQKYLKKIRKACIS